jgi:hypothetical protein
MLMNNLAVNLIPIDLSNDFLLIAREYVEGGLVHSDLEFDDVAPLVTSGRWRLLVATNDAGDVCGAYTLAVTSTPTGVTATVVSACGVGLGSRQALDQLFEFARQLGATKAQALANDVAARLYQRVGFKKKATLIERKL